jgi:hypothetical protein
LKQAWSRQAIILSLKYLDHKLAGANFKLKIFQASPPGGHNEGD